MNDVVAIALDKALVAQEGKDRLAYAFHCGRSGGIAASTGVFGVKALEMCDDISDAWENGDEDLLRYIRDILTGQRVNGKEFYARTRNSGIGWDARGVALDDAMRALDESDEIRYCLMIGFALGLLLDDPGPKYDATEIVRSIVDHYATRGLALSDGLRDRLDLVVSSGCQELTIQDCICKGYEKNCKELIEWAMGEISSIVRASDAAFQEQMHYSMIPTAVRRFQDSRHLKRWVRNFGLRNARVRDVMPEDVQETIEYEVVDFSVEHRPRPIEMCYWVVPGRLLAGEYPGHREEDKAKEKLARLTGAGVSVFIDLTDLATTDGHLKPYAHLLDGPSHQPFAIIDQSVPASAELTKAALDAIDAHMEAGETVYVHCWGGVGRTGTIIGCWLARHYEPGQAALNRLRELWKENPKSRQPGRRSPETAEQEQYVREWDKAIDAVAGTGTAAEKIAEYHRITNTSGNDFDDLPRPVKNWYREDRIESESAVSFADLPSDAQDWYRQVAIAQVKADETGDYSALIALGAWPEDEYDSGE